MDKGVIVGVAVLVIGLGGTVVAVVSHSSSPVPTVASPQENPVTTEAAAETQIAEPMPSPEPAFDSPELADLLRQIGLPQDTRKPDECTDEKPLNPAVSSFQVCNDTPVTGCRFSVDDTCKVGSSFSDGRHVGVSYAYDATQIGPGTTKAALDKMFGKSKWQIVKPAHFDDGSWFAGRNASWKQGRIKITLMLMGGRNVQGVEYMNASLIFEDTTVPEPLDDGKGTHS